MGITANPGLNATIRLSASFTPSTDQNDPYNVYGGAQDGVRVCLSNIKASDDWHQTGQYPFRELMSGDGMEIQVDYRDNATVYTGYQFGNYFRINRYSGTTQSISPKHDLGERPLRFNWQTPIHLSRHQQDVLYFGANKLYRSFNKGEDWEAISEDLTTGGLKGQCSLRHADQHTRKPAENGTNLHRIR